MASRSSSSWSPSPLSAFRSCFCSPLKHLGVTNFAFGDGSVRVLRDMINLDVYRALSTCTGGEAISADSY